MSDPLNGISYIVKWCNRYVTFMSYFILLYPQLAKRKKNAFLSNIRGELDVILFVFKIFYGQTDLLIETLDPKTVLYSASSGTKQLPESKGCFSERLISNKMQAVVDR